MVPSSIGSNEDGLIVGQLIVEILLTRIRAASGGKRATPALAQAGGRTAIANPSALLMSML